MARTLRGLTLAVVLSIIVSCSQRTENATLFDQWLANADAHTDNTKLIAEILANRTTLERQFIGAFRNGPSAASRDEVEASVEHVWSLEQVQLAEPDVYNLDEQDIAELKSISLATEKSEALERFEYNFKATMLRGLGITRGEEAKALLTQIARDPSSRFRMIAGDILLSNKGS